MTIRVVIADDQALVRTGFGAIIRAQRDMTLVGEAADGAAAVDLALLLRPDIVLMDVRMPRLDGIAATRAIVAQAPETRVLVLTTFDLDEYVLRALSAGAGGFLLKDADAGELLRAIRAVCAGDAVVAPSATRRLLDRYVTGTPDAAPGGAADQLTERERQVVVRVAQGLTNGEIANALHLAESTVKTHINRILAKLELRDRVALVVFAYDAGLVAARTDPERD